MGFQSPAAQFDGVTAQVLAMTQPQIVAEAKRLHAEVMNADPRPVNYVRHVDGVEAPEEAVRPDGVIVYDYNRLDLVAQNALDLLRQASPVKSGEYVRSHLLLLNLHPVDNLKNWQPGDEISITNIVPYSRVIERGMRGKRPVKFNAPPHVYERVAQRLRQVYREVADIQFTYRAVIAGLQVDQLGVATAKIGEVGAKRDAHGRFAKGNANMRRAGGTQAHNKMEVRWPTITINPAGSFYARAGLN